MFRFEIGIFMVVSGHAVIAGPVHLPEHPKTEGCAKDGISPLSA